MGDIQTVNGAMNVTNRVYALLEDSRINLRIYFVCPRKEYLKNYFKVEIRIRKSKAHGKDRD